MWNVRLCFKLPMQMKSNFPFFCKKDLKMAEVKSYDFVKTYFSDPGILVTAIKKYHEMSKVQKGEYTLLDLLR